MKTEKKIFLQVMLSLATLIIVMVAVHGCGVSSYVGKTLSSISIAPVANTASAGAVTIPKQTVQQFKVTGNYSDSTTVDLSSSSTWTTSDAAVATVVNGLATAVASSGTCTITAKSQGLSSSIGLIVQDMTVQTITVSPGTASTNQGFTLQYTATGLFSGVSGTLNQDITALATWNSSAPSIATIDGAGLATAIAAGTTNVTAAWNSVTSNTAVLTVSNVALKSITVSESNKAKDDGTTAQLTATGTFVDNTTQDLTAQVAWGSSDTSVATVNSSGLVTPVAAGRVTFTATAGGKTGSLLTSVAHVGH